jgi:hypothetical protein
LFRASVEGSYNEELKDWRGWLLMAYQFMREHQDEYAIRETVGIFGVSSGAYYKRAKHEVSPQRRKPMPNWRTLSAGYKSGITVGTAVPG